MQYKEGDLYKILSIEGVSIEIRYGYYDPEIERGNIEPMPIFPDFVKHPLYTDTGYPFITADQAVCSHFKPKPKISDEGWCNDCEHLELYDGCLGICRSPKNRVKKNE